MTTAEIQSLDTFINISPLFLSLPDFFIQSLLFNVAWFSIMFLSVPFFPALEFLSLTWTLTDPQTCPTRLCWDSAVFPTPCHCFSAELGIFSAHRPSAIALEKGVLCLMVPQRSIYWQDTIKVLFFSLHSAAEIIHAYNGYYFWHLLFY